MAIKRSSIPSIHWSSDGTPYQLAFTFDQWPYTGKRVVVLSSGSPQVPPHLAGKVEIMAGHARQDRPAAGGNWRPARLRRWRQYHPTLPPRRADPGTDDHSPARPDRKGHPFVRRAPAGHQVTARRDKSLSERFRAKQVSDHGLYQFWPRSTGETMRSWCNWQPLSPMVFPGWRRWRVKNKIGNTDTGI